jgi:hypothetical protein
MEGELGYDGKYSNCVTIPYYQVILHLVGQAR